MLQQLTNLSDKELISRARKLKDQEAEGVLLERYSHLLVAVCLPYLSNGAGNSSEVVFSTILQRLSSSLKTQTIHKANEWIYYTIKAQQNKPERNIPYFPLQESKEMHQFESKVEKATVNAKEQQLLLEKIRQAMQQLSEEERYFLQQFYVEQQTFTQLADAKKYTVEKIRQTLKQAKQKMASLLMN